MDVFSNPKFTAGIIGIADAYGGLNFWVENLYPRMNPTAIWQALLYIGCLKKTGYERQIINLLIHKDSRVRAWACFALGQLENEESVEQIHAMNADPSNRVRIHAWQAMQKIVGPEQSYRLFPIRVPQQQNVILISDDNPGPRMNLSNLFRRMGYRTDTAATYKETIEKAMVSRPQAIITDNQKIPDNLSGLTMTQDISRIKELQDTVVFMLTADFVEPVFLWNGGDCFLSKFRNSVQELSEVVNEYLHH